MALDWLWRLFAWQAWILATLTCTLRGRRGTYGTGLALVARLGSRRGCLHGRRGPWRHRLSLCVALGDINLHFAAGVALGDIDVHSAWQAWHFWHCTGSGALGYFGRRGCLLGRRCTWRHRPSLCVAGVALGDINLHFAAGVALGDIDVHSAWQAWHFWHCTGSGALGYFGRRGCLLGRRCTWRHRPSLCVAGVALGDINLQFAAGVALGDIDVHSAW